MLDEAIQKEIIQKGREFLKSPLERDPYEEAFESDQDRKLPQPPLVKAWRTRASALRSRETFPVSR